MRFGVCLGQPQMQQAVVSPTFRPSEIVNGLLNVAAENSWSLHIDLAKSHVSASGFKSFIDLDDASISRLMSWMSVKLASVLICALPP
jgi:hypothetical protein